MDQIWQQLAASGPLALVLGLAVYVLWSSNRELRQLYEGDPKDPEQKPGRIAQLQRAAQAREDAIREFYEGKLKVERDEQKELLKELNATLRGSLLDDGSGPAGR